MEPLKRKLSTVIIILVLILSMSSVVYAEPGDTIVYVTNTGTKYHKDGCSYLKKSKIEITLQNAIEKGYLPCEKCNAPKNVDDQNPEPNPNPDPQPTPNAVTQKFSDVENKWYVPAVQYAIDNGIMSGTSETTFEPDTNCTRTMMVQILWSSTGKMEPSVSNPFSDIKENDWFYRAVLWAVENGITSGTSATTFGTTDVTREQMTLFLMNYAKNKGYDITLRADMEKFVDANLISGWALESLEWANANGIISGKGGGKLDPKGNATRAEVAAMIMSFQNKFGK